MKINLIKTGNDKFWPADEEDLIKIKKLKKGDVYKADVTVNQNYELHKKIFGFFVFCCNYNYGDIEAGKDPYYLEEVRKDLTISAGYYKQVFERNGVDFRLVALSLKYESMPDDERQGFYKRVTQAALDNIFNNGADDNVINQLLSWF
jgi:hypothetical protein